MVLAERHTGITDVLMRTSKREIGPTRPSPMATPRQPEALQVTSQATPWINFIDFHNPQLNPIAKANGLNTGRVFIKNKTAYAHLYDAFLSGAAERVGKRMKPKKLEQIQKIVFFTVCTDATLNETAPLVDYKNGESVSRSFKRFIDSVQKEVGDTEEIWDFKKPKSQRTRDKASEAKGGRRKILRELVASGVTSPKEVARRLGITENNATVALTRLRSQKILPESIRPKNVRLLEKARKAETDEEFALILKTVSKSLIMKNPKDFIFVGSILKNAGYTFYYGNLKYFITSIEKSRIPHKKITFKGHKNKYGKRFDAYGYCVLPQQTSRVLKAILNDPNSSKFLKMSDQSKNAVDNTKAAM